MSLSKQNRYSTVLLVCDKAGVIVKCQRSIETTEAAPQLLIYNRARDWMLQCDLTEDWNKHFGPTTSPDDNRFFAEVKRAQRSRAPQFVRRLREQSW
jgi:hypothetical protein